MIFLTKEDFKKQIKENYLQQMIDRDETVLDSAELEAMEEISSYLRGRYDLTNVFNPILEEEGDTRNKVIVMYMIDIAIYHLCSRISPEKFPDNRIARYDNALSYLMKVSKGLVSIDLPLKVVEGVSTGFVAFGSNQKFDFGLN